ncbi:MAG: trehalose-phosphatase [Gammaproteobacteria bacterium]
MPTHSLLDRARFDAVLFDMDGVVTDTASAHAAAWKRLFDGYLEARAAREGSTFQPFDANAEYREHVDGKPRYDGVQSFLAARGIELPYGAPADGPERETVCGLGNRKDDIFHDWLSEHRVRAFPGTVEFIERLRSAGVRVGIFSASRNTEAVLASAQVDGLFDALVDGQVMTRLGLPGKPDPAMLRTEAEVLEVRPDRCVIVEDAIAGVEAGRRGRFAFVIGIDRAGYAGALEAHGADLVVNDLSECRVCDDGTLVLKHTDALEPVRSRSEAVAARLRDHRLAVLLDYDGTLTPIVSDYRKAVLPAAMRATLAGLAARHTVAVVSGRDLEDVRRLVGLDAVFYSGSHGFELAGPGGWHHTQEAARTYLPDLDDAETALAAALADIPGHAIERKRFSIAVHYRQVAAARAGDVERAVDELLAANARLVKGLGKKVFELKPALDWDKGRAVELLLEKLGMTRDDTLALYVGDDITDEAVFRVLRHPHLSIVIGDGVRVTAADYTLDDCDDVQRFLDWLAHAASGGAA